MEYKIERGSVWWANLPKDELNSHCQYGERPVVVISNDECNEHSPCTIVCPITTKEDKYKSIHPWVKVKGDIQSYVLCEQPRTIDKSMLRKYQRKLSRTEMDFVDRALMLSIGLSTYVDKLNELKAKLYDMQEAQSRCNATNESLDTSATAIGEHVKAIMTLLSNELSTCSNNMNDQEDGSFAEATSCSRSSNSTYSKSVPHTNQIDKFNARLAKTREIQSNSKVVNKPNTALGRTNATKWSDERIHQFVKDFKLFGVEYVLRKYNLKSAATAKKYYSKYRKLIEV